MENRSLGLMDLPAEVLIYIAQEVVDTGPARMERYAEDKKHYIRSLVKLGSVSRWFRAYAGDFWKKARWTVPFQRRGVDCHYPIITVPLLGTEDEWLIGSTSQEDLPLPFLKYVQNLEFKADGMGFIWDYRRRFVVINLADETTGFDVRACHQRLLSGQGARCDLPPPVGPKIGLLERQAWDENFRLFVNHPMLIWMRQRVFAYWLGDDGIGRLAYVKSLTIHVEFVESVGYWGIQQQERNHGFAHTSTLKLPSRWEAWKAWDVILDVMPSLEEVKIRRRPLSSLADCARLLREHEVPLANQREWTTRPVCFRRDGQEDELVSAASLPDILEKHDAEIDRLIKTKIVMRRRRRELAQETQPDSDVSEFEAQGGEVSEKRSDGDDVPTEIPLPDCTEAAETGRIVRTFWQGFCVPCNEHYKVWINCAASAGGPIYSQMREPL